MKKNNKFLYLTILLVVVVGLGVGFAAFSSMLTINTAASVNPENTFKVEFSKSFRGVTTGELAASVSSASGVSTPTASNAILSSNQLTNIQANFTEPGQTVTYSFYINNTGEYNAYLTSLETGAATNSTVFKSCVADENGGATPTLVAAACNGISVKFSVMFASKTITSVGVDTTFNPGSYLGKGLTWQATLEISYAKTADRVDGPMTINLGDIKLNFSTAEN